MRDNFTDLSPEAAVFWVLVQQVGVKRSAPLWGERASENISAQYTHAIKNPAQKTEPGF